MFAADLYNATEKLIDFLKHVHIPGSEDTLKNLENSIVATKNIATNNIATKNTSNFVELNDGIVFIAGKGDRKQLFLRVTRPNPHDYVELPYRSDLLDERDAFAESDKPYLLWHSNGDVFSTYDDRDLNVFGYTKICDISKVGDMYHLYLLPYSVLKKTRYPVWWTISSLSPFLLITILFIFWGVLLLQSSL